MAGKIADEQLLTWIAGGVTWCKLWGSGRGEWLTKVAVVGLGRVAQIWALRGDERSVSVMGEVEEGTGREDTRLPDRIVIAILETWLGLVVGALPGDRYGGYSWVGYLYLHVPRVGFSWPFQWLQGLECSCLECIHSFG